MKMVKLFAHTHRNGDIWKGYVENGVLKLSVNAKSLEHSNDYIVLGIFLDQGKMYRVGGVKGVKTDTHNQIEDISLNW